MAKNKKRTQPRRARKAAWSDPGYVPAGLPGTGGGGFMADWAQEMQTQNQTPGVYVGDQAQGLVIGIPLPTLAQRLLFQTDHLPFGRTIHCYGLTESQKSSFCFDLMRLFCAVRGGENIYNLTESARDQAVLRNSTVGYRFRNRVIVRMCPTLEDWQISNTDMIKRLLKVTGRPGGYAYPLGVFLDSLVGAASRKTIEGIEEDGHASVNFSAEANLINIYTKYIFGRVAQWPMIWCATNHMKVSTDRNYQTVKRTGGGSALGFYSTFMFEMKRLRDYKYANGVRGRQVEMTVIKNSLGDGRTKINVDMLWWTEDGAQVTAWDWNAATINYLMKLHDIASKDTWKKRIAQIVDLDVVEATQRVTSKTLGIKNISATEAGMALEANDAVREGLNELFGIHRGRTFIPGVPYCEQVQWAMNDVPLEPYLPGGPNSIFEPYDPEAERQARLEASDHEKQDGPQTEVEDVAT